MTFGSYIFLKQPVPRNDSSFCILSHIVLVIPYYSRSLSHKIKLNIYEFELKAFHTNVLLLVLYSLLVLSPTVSQNHQSLGSLGRTKDDWGRKRIRYAILIPDKDDSNLCFILILHFLYCMCAIDSVNVYWKGTH